MDPIGHRITLGDADGEGEVVGIVRDGIRDISLEHDTLKGDIYAPLKLTAERLPEIWVRTYVDPGTVMKAISELGRTLDANVAVKARGPLSEVFKIWTNAVAGVGCAVGILGVLALFLAAIGVNGIVSFAVAQRRREIGIRLALGASQKAIGKLILGEGIRLVGRGLILGGIIAVEVATLLRSVLFGLSPADPVSLVAVGLLLGGVALLGCWFPARTATKVDPMVALRCE